MKKMLAILLTLVMALSCTAALAETAETTPGLSFAGLTVQSEYDVDMDVLHNVLNQMGVGEGMLPVFDTIASIVNEAGEKLVVAQDGIQYELLLKDTALVNIVAQISENGLNVVSNLVPGFALSASPEELTTMLSNITSKSDALAGIDMAALQAAIAGYSQNFATACTQAITAGQPEMGEFEAGDYTFNVKIPMNVDVAALAEAIKALFTDLSNDENVKAAIEALGSAGVNLDLSAPAESESLDPANFPTVEVNVYATINEQGQQEGATDVTFSVTPPAESEATGVTGHVLVDGRNVTVHVEDTANASTCDFAIQPRDTGMSCRFDIETNGMYVGLAGVYEQGDTSVVDGYVYVIDDQNPLFTSHSTLTNSGELTLSADTEGKTVLGVSELSNPEALQEKASGLAMDVMGGLFGLLSTAAEVMPDEVGAIQSMIFGGLGGAEAPAEEVPAA